MSFITELLKTNSRSEIAKKNIVGSFFVKGGNILINLLYVPLLINTLGKTEYGIWLILTSIVGWLAFFDIGVGNGLRNKFAEAKAVGNTELARIYVSTTYATISIIFTTICLIISVLIPLLNWNKILNTYDIANTTLISVVYVVFIFFILRFITQIISVILLSDQRTALSSSLNLISSIIVFLIIFTLNKLQFLSLFLCSAILSSIPVLVFIIASIYFFTFDYRLFRPSISHVNFRYARPLFTLGVKFLIIQISGLIFYTSTNILITQFYSPNEVTIYNIAYKYFAISNMIFGIILAPMWSAITEAYSKGDLDWISRIMKKLKFTALILSVIVILMLIFSNQIYRFWIGTSINIPFELSAILAISSIVYLFFVPYAHFLNGVSKIKLNMILVIGQSVLYLPVAYLFAKTFNLGVSGIIIAGLVCEIPLRITQPMQYKLLITKKAYGIWNK